MADNMIIRDGNNNPASLRTVDLGSDLHVPMHGRFYRDIPDVTGTLSAIGHTVSVDVRNITGLVLGITSSAASGAAAAFEFSLNSTDGVNGVWYGLQAQRTNALDAFDTGFSGISATPSYCWNMTAAGFSWIRVRMTALTSGSIGVVFSPCDDLMFPSRPPSTQQVIGNVAHDGASTGSPVRIGTKAVTAMPGPVSANNDVVDTIATSQGVTLVTFDSVSAQRLRASASLTTTADVALFGAQGTNLRGNLTDLQAVNTGASTVDLILKDGTTEIWRLPLPPGVPVIMNGIRTPIQTSVNAALNASLSAAGTVRVNVMGYQAV